MSNKAAEHQKDPEKNSLPCVQDMVVADIEARKVVGIERYGTVLQPFNGRSALMDAYQEALDLAIYLRQLLYEEQNPYPNCEHCGPVGKTIEFEGTYWCIPCAESQDLTDE